MPKIAFGITTRFDDPQFDVTFVCARMHATMRKSVCLKRQTQGLTYRENPMGIGLIPDECQNCGPGKVLLKEAEMAKANNDKQQETTTKSDFTININKDNSRIADYPDAEEKLKMFSIRHVRSIEDQCLFYILEGLSRDINRNEAGPM